MSNLFNRKNQNINIKKRNDYIYKKKLDKTCILNSNNFNTNANYILNHFLSKTTKNSPRSKNSSIIDNQRNKSHHFKHLSKQISKSNLRIENSLDSTGTLKKIKFKTKKLNLNIKTINMNLEIKKYPYETNNNNLSFVQNKDMHNLQDKIYEILNKKINKIDNSIYTKNNCSNSIEKENNNFPKNLNRINTSLNRSNKSQNKTNKDNKTPIKTKIKCLSIKKTKDINTIKKNDILFNSLKNNFIKKTSYKKQKHKYNNNNNNYSNKAKQKKLIKDLSKNETPKNNNEKINIKNKTKFNEISFNNIPKIFQFNNSNNKKQTRNINYHKKQPSLSLTKTSIISQCNFTESNSLDNMSNQITINKNQNTMSNYNNSTTISNDKSSQYNTAISLYNKLIKENNELKQNNYNLNQHIKKINLKINVLKSLLNNIILIYKNNIKNIINKYKERENEMKNNLIKYNEFTKKIIYYTKYYSFNEINKNTKNTKIIQQILSENKILRNLYNNLLLFDVNMKRLYTNQSDNNTDQNEFKDSIKLSMCSISNRSNKFLEDEENENKKLNKRSDTAEQRKKDDIDIIGINRRPQSRNYNNQNELNTDLINDNKNLKKCFIRKINYKIKK